MFGVVLGAVTGYFNAAVGLLYVISGTLGLIAASGCKRRVVSLLVCLYHSCFPRLSSIVLHVLASSLQFFVLLVLTSIAGLGVNVVGLMQPTLVTNTDARDFGFAVVAPSVIWFIFALLFLAIFCIPCVTVASVNMCSCCSSSGNNKDKPKKQMQQPTSSVRPRPASSKETTSRKRHHGGGEGGLDEEELSVLREAAAEAKECEKQQKEGSDKAPKSSRQQPAKGKQHDELPEKQQPLSDDDDDQALIVSVDDGSDQATEPQDNIPPTPVSRKPVPPRKKPSGKAKEKAK